MKANRSAKRKSVATKSAAPRKVPTIRPKEPDQSLIRKNTLRLWDSDYPGKSRERVEAESALSPIHANAQTARSYARETFGVLDLTYSTEILAEKVATLKGGDLSDIEATLLAQSVALDSIFTALARRAALNVGEYMNAAETYLRLSLKAQSQCRATLETLAAIKNPPVIYAKQANIANGPQQVNNGLPAPSQAGEKLIEQSKLSGGGNELLPDARASSTAGEANKAMETLGEIERPEVHSR